ncbi:MAG TPA: hypothetical protein DCE41_28575 [Cytophagales bacterium]|nr:hypothetical protein [Cytophagales bacterium]HAA20957.1 hypothetical protein [Cytophagales bacterium]HAP63517.1 hypothetical protein [Cytophagales bacterium]
MGKYKTPTRGRILDESRELIFKNGFGGTTVDQIIERAGITKGAFFYHFKSKADLALALVEDFALFDRERHAQALSATEHLVDQPKQRLLAFIQFYIQVFEELQEPPGCLFASVSNQQNLFEEEVKQVVTKAFTEWERVFAELLDAVLAQHPPKKAIDRASLLSHFNVVLEGAFILSKAMNDPKAPTLHLRQLKDYLDLLFED